MKSKGFTLVELMVVLTVIALLLSIVVPDYVGRALEPTSSPSGFLQLCSVAFPRPNKRLHEAAQAARIRTNLLLDRTTNAVGRLWNEEASRAGARTCSPST